MLPEVDAEVETGTIDGEDVTAIGTVAAVAGDSKKTLRDHLRKTLYRKGSSSGELLVALLLIRPGL